MPTRRTALALMAAPLAAASLVAGADEGDPRREIAAQLELLKAGDADGLKKHFTVRLRDRITKEAVAEAAGALGGVTLDELVATVTYGEWEGRKTAKLGMKNGRSLTTLVLVDGRWLADTIWFR
jgi:hypothetical protein